MIKLFLYIGFQPKTEIKKLNTQLACIIRKEHLLILTVVALF